MKLTHLIYGVLANGSLCARRSYHTIYMYIQTVENLVSASVELTYLLHMRKIGWNQTPICLRGETNFNSCKPVRQRQLELRPRRPTILAVKSHHNSTVCNITELLTENLTTDRNFFLRYMTLNPPPH